MIVTKDWLKSKTACLDAYEWAESRLGDGLPLDECIDKMDRADWLLWLLFHARVANTRQMVYLACKVGRLSLRHVPAGEDRPSLAYEAAEAWVRNPTRAAGDAA